MPGIFFRNIFESDASEIVKLYRSIKGSLKKSSAVENIIKFSKALAECSIPESYVVEDILKDTVKNLREIKDVELLWNKVVKKKALEWVFCLPVLVIGLTKLIETSINDIYNELKLFTRSTINILPEMVKGIGKALSDASFVVFDNLIDGIYYGLLGFALYGEEQITNFSEKNIMKFMGFVGKSIALYMTLFVEFRWAMIVIFVNNVKTLIDDRIKRMNDLRKALVRLRYEEAIYYKDFFKYDQLKISLEFYREALRLLEDSIPLVNRIEKDLFKYGKYNKKTANRVKKNFDDAEDLLLKHRNKFLEKIIGAKSITDAGDVDKEWHYYLSNEYSDKISKDIVRKVSKNPLFWKISEDIDAMYKVKVSLDRCLYNLKIGNDNKLYLSKPKVNLHTPYINSFWVEQKTYFDVKESDYIYFNDYFYIVKKVEKQFINFKNLNLNLIAPKDTLLFWYCNGYQKIEFISDGNGGYTKVYKDNNLECGYDPNVKVNVEENIEGYTATFLLLEPADFYDDLKTFTVPTLTDKFYVEVFRKLNNAMLVKKYKIFKLLEDGTYQIITVPQKGSPEGVETTNQMGPPPTFLKIGEDGIKTIRKSWGASKNFSLFILFKIDNKYEHLIITGLYPNLVEKESERIDKLLEELPEPFKNIYKNFSKYENKKLRDFTGKDFLNIASELSVFLFGKDIISPNIYMPRDNVLKYDLYLETASTVLKNLCPLKNNYFYFYFLLHTLEKLDIDFDITNTIVLRDWIGFINRVILDTLTSMTYKDPATGKYNTIKTIEEKFYTILPAIILDVDNIEMMKMLLTTNNELGLGLNQNRKLEKIYFRFVNFIKWLRDVKFVEQIEAAEIKTWDIIYQTITSTVHIMLTGERVSVIHPIMKKMVRRISVLMNRLNLLSSYLNQFLIDSNTYEPIILKKEMKMFQKVLYNSGMKHFYEYIKNGQWSVFINDKLTEWTTEYGGIINCLIKYRDKYLKSFDPKDKFYLDKVIKRLMLLQRYDILGQFETNISSFYKSLNINFINKVPEGLKTSLSKNLKLIEAARKVKESIKEKLLIVN